MTATVPSKIWIQGFTVQMVDSSGGAITNRLLHHVNVVDPDHRELFTPTARRLFAAGQETRSESIPGFLGVPVEAGQRLLVTAMFHNPTDRSYPGSRLQVILRYREKGWPGPVSVYPVYLDAMGPVGRKDCDLPPGRSERSWQGSPAIRGRLLGIGGHLHRYAEVLRFEDLTA